MPTATVWICPAYHRSQAAASKGDTCTITGFQAGNESGLSPHLILYIHHGVVDGSTFGLKANLHMGT